MDDTHPSNERVNELCKAIADGVHKMANTYRNPSHRLGFIMSVALVPGTVMVQALGKYRTYDKFEPTPDDFLLASLVYANSITYAHHMPDGQANGFVVEFDVAYISKAMEQYTKLTGRDPRVIMNESLVALVDEVIEDTKSAFTGNLAKFLPN